MCVETPGCGNAKSPLQCLLPTEDWEGANWVLRSESQGQIQACAALCWESQLMASPELNQRESRGKARPREQGQAQEEWRRASSPARGAWNPRRSPHTCFAGSSPAQGPSVSPWSDPSSVWVQAGLIIASHFRVTRTELLKPFGPGELQLSPQSHPPPPRGLWLLASLGM